MIFSSLEVISTLFTILVIIYYVLKYPSWLVATILGLGLLTLNRVSSPDNATLFVLSRLNVGLLAYLVIDYLKLKKKIQYMKADRHWAALLLSSIYGIIGTDLNGTILHWNPGAENIYGWKEDEVKGKNIKDIIMPKGKEEEHKQLFDKVVKGEKVDAYNLERLTKKGRTIKVDSTFSPVYKPDTKEVIGATAIIRSLE